MARNVKEESIKKANTLKGILSMQYNIALKRNTDGQNKQNPGKRPYRPQKEQEKQLKQGET